MELRTKGPYYKAKRRLYWGEIYLIQGDAKSAVLVCASRNYIDDIPGSGTADKKAKDWLNEVSKELKNVGPEVFEKEVHYRTYSSYPEGDKNGLEFLKGVTPDH